MSTFDTFSHIGPLARFEQAIAKAAFFMEKGGVFVFDLNTPYKHARVLAGQTFTVDAGDAVCRWRSDYCAADGRVDMTVAVTDRETGESWQERFSEYGYELETVAALLDRYGFALARTADGEDFGPVRPDSQRWILTAVKRYTQQQKGEENE